MNIRLHNTLTRQKDIFVPADPQRVTMYVCGPTVYNYVHIGNARPVVVFDVLYRLLSRHFPQVVYARNITDVDDKINAAAAANGEPIRVLAERFAAAYREDMAQLNALLPGVEPWATEHVPQMIALIKSLIERGHAYAAEGHVLFHVPSLSDYGKLSGRNREDMISGARIEVAPYKRDPADFVLWKPSTAAQPGWDSPWGFGRPGWHIECTAMINTHLGPSIDIHGGGQDLIFPHHENEIAQGEGAHGGQYCRYWLHNGYVTVDGEKMSKSLGNFRTVRDLLQHYPGEVIRYALLAGHYRKPLDFSLTALDQARAALDRLYGSLPATGSAPPKVRAEAVEAALADDLNTPLALACLHETASALRKCTDPDEQSRLHATLRDGADLLGLLQADPSQWRQQGGMAAVQTSGPSPEHIETLIAARQAARAARDFARADVVKQGVDYAAGLLKQTALYRTFFATKQGLDTAGAAVHASTETAKTAATVAGVTTRTTAETVASGQSVMMRLGSAISSIMISAWEAMAGAFAAMASIPYVGPFLAVGAGAAAFAAVAGIVGNLPSAAGGYDVPSGVNPITQIHEEEMVLPAKHANVIRNLADGGESAGGAVHHHYHIKAFDGQDPAGQNRQIGGTE